MACAQETNEVEQLKRQLREMQESFQRSQAEQKAQMEALQKQLEALSAPKPDQKAAIRTVRVEARCGYEQSGPGVQFRGKVETERSHPAAKRRCLPGRWPGGDFCGGRFDGQ